MTATIQIKLTPEADKGLSAIVKPIGISGSDVVLLKGEQNLYQLRVGKLIRVIFRFNQDGSVQIIDADNRDNIYR